LNNFILTSVFSNVTNEENKISSSFNTVYCNDKQLPFTVAAGEVSFNSSVVILRSDGAVAIFPQDVLEKLCFNYFKEKITPVFTKSIKNLLKIRNYLLLQLDLECGNISEDYFDKEEPKYLSEIKEIPLEKLKEEIKLLFGFTNLPLDSADISEILNCPIDDAEKVIHQYISGV